MAAHLATGARLSVEAATELDLGAGTGTMTVHLAVASGETIALPDDCRVRAVVLEHDVFYCCGVDQRDTWNHVARAVLPDRTLGISSSGEEEEHVWSFAIDPAWNPANLRTVAFVQRDTDASILNADVDGLHSTGILPGPGGVVLRQNVPNPFRAATSIDFELTRDAPVVLTIFDVAGRRVTDLVDGWRTAGPHSVSWSGTDSGGRALASGVYLYRLRAGGEAETRTLLLLR